MSRPRVSIIITSYNQEHYLREAIDSVLNQTVKPYEIIIADDHSTKDNSVGLIRAYASRYPGWIHALFQDENVGIPKNRNSALERTTGDLVAILDGDDRFLPRNIETQIAALAKHPDAGCSYSNRYSINARGQRIQIRDTTPMPSGDLLVQIAMGRSGILRSMVGRYDLIKAAGFLDKRFPLHDGFVLTLRLAKLTRFVYIADPLLEKREHEGGVSKQISREATTRYLEDVFSEVRKLTADVPPADAKRIETVWRRWIFEEEVWIEIEAGRKMKALQHVVREFARHPHDLHKLWNLTREIAFSKPRY
jgi:glycosyltransferase involved in cell wall biosynthesis